MSSCLCGKKNYLKKMFEPSYIKLHRSGELSLRAKKLESLLADCNICPKDCKVNRINNEIAACYSGYKPVVSSSLRSLRRRAGACRIQRNLTMKTESAISSSATVISAASIVRIMRSHRIIRQRSKMKLRSNASQR